MKKTLAILLLAGATFLTGCGDSQNDFVFTNNNGVITAPVCVDDAYAVNSNTTLTVNAANGVLANDTLNGATITNFATASANGGTVTGNADGSFVYVPQANFSGNDSFTYSLGNSAGTRTCTVTITVNAVNGFFVDAANGNDGTGSFTNGNPFATIQAAAAAAPAGSDIVVRAGNYTGTVTLENGDRLLGAGSVLAQGAAVRPTLTGPVILADGCTVDFVRIDGTAGNAVDATGQNSGTITNCEITNTTALGEGICAEDVSGTWNISNNTIDNVSGLGIDFELSGSDTATAVLNNNTLTNNDFDAIALTAQNTSQLDAQVHGNMMTGNATGATFETLVGNTAVVCLDIENNTNDDVYDFEIENTATCEVEELQTGPFSIPSNTGSVTVSAGGFFTDPVFAADGACGF